MRQRGRKSAEAQSKVVSLVPGTPPEPPTELTSEQRETWQMFVAQMPWDWFRGAAGVLLIQLVRHVGYSRLSGKAVTEELVLGTTLQEDEGLARLNRLTQIHEREGRAVVALMRALRLTPRSRYDQSRAHTAHQNTPQKKPWEAD
jgi:hypothetical protein